VSSVHHSQLAVRYNGVRTAKAVELEVTADFTLRGFALLVQGGRIRKIIKAGNIEGSGAVGFKDIKLTKSSGKIELSREID